MPSIYGLGFEIDGKDACGLMQKDVLKEIQEKGAHVTLQTLAKACGVELITETKNNTTTVYIPGMVITNTPWALTDATKGRGISLGTDDDALEKASRQILDKIAGNIFWGPSEDNLPRRIVFTKNPDATAANILIF